jgi:hypothetical protein
MAKKTRPRTKSKGQKRTPSNRSRGAGATATARSAGGRRKTAGAKTPRGKAARKRPTNPPRKGKVDKARSAKAAKGGRGATGAKGTKRAKATPAKPARATARRRVGGTGRESELAQTPQTGRTVKGPTNPMATRRSTGTAAGAGGTRRAPGLERARKQLREVEEGVPTPPSSLDLDRAPSAARSGRRELRDARLEHNETSPVMTGGDVDANWEDAYSVGDEAPGGDNPTPDQDRVDDIGKALGVEYQDNEELKASDKIAERDKHRWELDPASSEDYKDRDRD